MIFSPNEFYHVYNRGNNKQLLFAEEDNYWFFLQKIKTELSKHVHIVAYCLMPNHYHLLVYTAPSFNEENNKILLRKIGTLQSSYTRAFNNRYNKTGSLFQQKVKCKSLDSTEHQAEICFHYIHQNPLKAGLVKQMQDWEYSSFKAYSNNLKDPVIRKEIAYDFLAIPDNREDFLKESLGVIVFNEGY